LGGADTAGGDVFGPFASGIGAGVVVAGVVVAGVVLADAAGSAAWAKSNRAPFRPAELSATVVTRPSGAAKAIWENITSPIGAISFQRIFAMYLLVKLSACDLPTDPGTMARICRRIG
jgi:hypothetical protein